MYSPSQEVTRAEFVKVIVEALGLKGGAGVTSFSDNDSIPTWAKGPAAAATQAGLIHGYEEQGKMWFKPNQPITRAEMVVIFARVLELQSTGRQTEKIIFTDQSNIPLWVQSAVNITAGHKLINGYQDGSFRPGNRATRAETAKMIYMLLESLHI